MSSTTMSLRLFTRITLIAAAFGVANLAPSLAGSDVAVAAKAKKKKSKKHAAAKKFSAKSILKMHKQGLTDDEIVAKASAADYKLTAKEKAVLKKGKAPKSLIAALDPNGANVATAASAPAEEPIAVAKKPINIHKVTDPNDIDFDEVPPPAGMPKQYKDTAPKEQLTVTVKKPATVPNDEKPATASKPSTPTQTQSSQSSAQPVASANGGRRVVFTPGQ